MLPPETAKERLKAFEDKEEAFTRQQERVRALPSALGITAFALLGRAPSGGAWGMKMQGYQATTNREAAQEQAAAALDGLSLADRERVFSALYPKLGGLLAAWWLPASPGAAVPYQNGCQRKAFRVRGRPEITRAARLAMLQQLMWAALPYPEQDIAFYAAWAPYVGYAFVSGELLGRLFAAAIDRGGPEGDAVFDILLAAARGEHETGAMGRHVTRALLSAARPAGWEFCEKLLLAAQRQEGLRQTVLETVDEAHPEAFRRMLRLITEHELTRFSATIRALDVWFGFGWDAPSVKQADQAIGQIATYLEDPATRDDTLRTSDNGQAVYLALWTIAFDDATAAVAPATALLSDALTERRFAAARLLCQLDLDEARRALLPALDDPDLRVAAQTAEGLQLQTGALSDTDLFERLARNIPRFPKEPKVLDAILWPWMPPTASGTALANALVAKRGARPLASLLPYLPAMDVYGRGRVARLYAEESVPKTDETRDILFSFLSDASSDVRDTALKALAQFPAGDAVTSARLEALLTRKSGDLRRSVLNILLNGPDDAVLASGARLLASKQAPQRVAGLDLLGQMVAKDRSAAQVRGVAAAYTAERGGLDSLSGDERTLAEPLLEAERETPTLANALGLMDPAKRTAPVPPRRFALPPGVRFGPADPEEEEANGGIAEALSALAAFGATLPAGITERFQALKSRLSGAEAKKTAPAAAPPNAPGGSGPLPPGPLLVTDAARDLLPAVDALVEAHREMPIRFNNWYGDEEEGLLGSDGGRLPRPDYTLPLDEDTARFPLRDLLETWWSDHGSGLDAFDLLRTSAALRSTGGYSFYRRGGGWTTPLLPTLFVPLPAEKRERQGALGVFVAWLMRLHPPAASADFLMDAAEFTFSLVPEKVLPGITLGMSGGHRQDWRDDSRFGAWVAAAREAFVQNGGEWAPEQVRRFWRLLRWRDEPHPDADRDRPKLEETLIAFRSGAATAEDLYDLLLGDRSMEGRRYHGGGFAELRELSGRKPSPHFERTPGLREIYDRCRDRILAVELARGDTPTAATGAAQSLRYVGGAEVLARTLRALGKGSFVRGYARGEDRSAAFSHIVRATFPGLDDTPETFAAAMRAAGIPDKRLVETAVYAPQWARHIEAKLGWPQFAEAVWWLHAHTKDRQWSVDEEVRESWTAEIGDKTPLTAEDLQDGAVDVAWFHRVYEALGADRWKLLDEAAKFTSSAGGHKRAQLYADAMLGRLDGAELRKRIAEKRNQDALRALGLIPLPPESDRAVRDAETLSRYKLVQEFRRTSKQFGAMRQESEKQAARIALENLARTAGYPDPIRLEWAMEAEAVAGLRDGESVRAASGEVTVSLRITAFGEPELTFLKNERPIKTLPPAIKKDPAIAALVNRRREIERQRARMRLSLEEAMCRGDQFAGAELAALCEHPILQPMLRSLVFVGEEATPLLGYPAGDGRTLEDLSGNAAQPIPADARLRLAHPHDLLRTGRWDQWQRDCFLRERIQPFKQIFRELYVLTDQERADQTLSRRYAGHQVNPKQAMALFGKRGWVSSYEEGVRRTFHEARVSATVEFMGWTGSPADVEGLTIETIRFTRRGEWQPLPLTTVEPRLFSEAMRDLDLVVSVAHQGGVDPEASASTVEMRAALVREAAALLKLGNVRFEKSHVLIDGHLGAYSIHLGSAVVHRQPGGFVCIVPVHLQHRGRLFLPFMDDDPRTAEVVSKVLLLAKDKEINDPTILEQIMTVK